MIVYNSITDYLQHAKTGDIIVLGGYGIIDGLKSVQSKYDTYKVHETTDKTRLRFTAYRHRTRLTTAFNNQQVGVMTKKEFNQLPI